MFDFLVTGYINMDLDGAASAYAYAEFLNKQGKTAVAGIFGKLHQEAEFVFKQFKIEPLANAAKMDYEEVVLVDASDAKWIDSRIRLGQVVAVFDHRQVNQVFEFKRAKIQIELVGAAATLVAEQFFESNVLMSVDTAKLLYLAIVSNTINFKADVTTKRDVKVAERLFKISGLPAGFVLKMFEYKSKFKHDLKTTMVEFTGINYSLSTGIVQLEILEADDFVKNNFDKIVLYLNQIKQEKKLDFIFLTCIDIGRGFNLIVAADKSSKKLVSDIFKVKFRDNITRFHNIIMRKQMWTLIKNKFE